MTPRAQSSAPVAPKGTAKIPQAEVRDCLDRLLSSPSFIKVERPSRFLRYLVENALAGKGPELKESVLGMEIFGRPPSWDPRLDPIVRQEAWRLRKRLAKYYENEGSAAPLRIELAPGGYVPTFRRVESLLDAADPLSPAPQAARSRRLAWALAVSALIAAAALLAWWLPPRPPAPRPGQTEAEQLYLKGRYSWNARTPKSLTMAVDLFTEAVVRDPKYAPAYVGLADCYNLLREFATMPDEEAYPRSRAAAKQALALDDRLAEAHNSLAFGEFWWNWNAAGAEREFQRATQLDPRYATAHHWYATFLFELGRFDDARTQIEIAQKLEPASRAIVTDRAAILFSQGHRQEATAIVKQIVQTDPDFSSGHQRLSSFYLVSGDYRLYLAEMESAARLRGDQPSLALAAAARRGLARAGPRGMWEEILRLREERYQDGKAQAFDVADALASLGRNSEALDYLEISIQKRESQFPQCYAFHPFTASPIFDGIRARFRQILKTGLQR